MKPNYMVIGSAKCASTSLCSLLGSHPDIFMFPGKEPNFFCYDEVYAWGFDWYESLFDEAGSARMRGEGSPRYTIRNVYPQTAPRIAKYAPELMLIYIVRHPLERIRSGWLEMRSWGSERAHHSFDKAVMVNRNWLIDSSNYWQEINCYRDYYPDENILVVFFEDFKTDYQSVMRRCFEFLGVDPRAPVDGSLRHLNPSKNKKVPRAILSVAQSLPYLMAVAKLLPESFRNLVRHRLFLKQVKESPILKPATKKWVAEELREDIETFLRFYGKPSDYWNLLP